MSINQHSSLVVRVHHTPCRYFSPINFTDENIPFADGGSADNLAITPLLRRRVTKMVVLVAAVQNITSSNGSADWGGYQWDVSSLFGAAPLTHPSYDKRSGNGSTITGIPSDLFNRKMQVCLLADAKVLLVQELVAE